ncbi:hypothetical protein DI43_00860 [Geobacillus sp. CAMR12739]|nr:hypothetical protein DI43_00860 [Geobacillus sp. CAMR12739]
MMEGEQKLLMDICMFKQNKGSSEFLNVFYHAGMIRMEVCHEQIFYCLWLNSFFSHFDLFSLLFQGFPHFFSLSSFSQKGVEEPDFIFH